MTEKAKAKPVKKVTNKPPKYEKGAKVKLVNKWAKQFKEDGLDAVVVSVGHDKNGEPRYALEVLRPMAVAAMEGEFK